MSDHIINAHHCLSVLITVVFNAMVIHGMSLQSMLIRTMIPILKAKRQVVCKSDKFKEASHLGHGVCSQDSNSLVKSAINSFWRGFNLFAAEFGSSYGFVKCTLFKQYCCSFYGSHLWALNSKGFKTLYVAWRKALRMLWMVHHMTHNDIIATMSEMLPLEIHLNYRFAKFYNKCKSHESQLAQIITMVASSNAISPVSTNIKNAHKGDLLYRNMIVDDVNIIKELIDFHEKLQIYKCSYYV